MPATRRLILIIIVLLILLLFLTVPGVSLAQASLNAWQNPARELAKKIAAIASPRQTVTLSVRNISSLADSEVAAVRLALEAELRVGGLRLAAKPNGAPELRITLSENLQGLLWVAELLRSDSREVAMVSLPKPAGREIQKKASEFVLEKKLLWEQGEQILDVALLYPIGVMAQRMLVLSPEKLSLFEWANSRFEFRQSVALLRAVPWPRDLRGKLLAIEENGKSEDEMMIVVVLPGMGCEVALTKSPATPAANCVTRTQKDAETPELLLWMLTAGAGLTDTGAEFSESRNFLTGKLFGENGWRGKVEPFFSAAFLPGEKGPDLTIFAGVDGRAAFYEGTKLLATSGGWGSDLTSVNTGCGSGWQVFASRPGDWTEPDAVIAYEVADGQAVAVTSPLEFPGPVKYLGPEFLPGSTREPKDRNNHAIAVSLNLKTGRYEAHTLALSCGR